MIGRRRILLAAAALAAVPLARAQRAPKTAVLGLLSPSPPRTPEYWTKSPVVAKLKSLGWVYGENLHIEGAYSSGVSRFASCKQRPSPLTPRLRRKV